MGKMCGRGNLTGDISLAVHQGLLGASPEGIFGWSLKEGLV